MINLKTITKALSAFAVGGMMMLSAHQAQALIVEGSYTVNVSNSDPGLVVHTQNVFTNPFSVNLTPGVTKKVDLFKIWTNETSVNYNEDNVPRSASVDWVFTAPVGGASSAGASKGGYFWFFQYGAIEWDNPTIVTFANGAKLKVRLSHEIFNAGVLGLTPGYDYGAMVTAKLKLIKKGIDIPEPGALALLSTGLLGMGILLRRRRRHG